MTDPFNTQMVQKAAQRLHDADACEERVYAMAPDSPQIADEDNVTADERDAIRAYLAARTAWGDQYDAARADKAEALRAYSFAHRLATGRSLDETAAEVMHYLVMYRGAADVIRANQRHTPAPRDVSATIARHARPREAGRPGHRTNRSSAASGDSGDEDGPGLHDTPPWGRVNGALARLLARIGGTS